MTTNTDQLPGDTHSRFQRAGTSIVALSFVVLLVILVGRVFLDEVPFRVSALELDKASPRLPPGDREVLPRDRTELARVTFAMGILAAGALWGTGSALSGRLIVRHHWLGVGIIIFAALSLMSALGASSRRDAMDTWIEQVALLSCAFLGAQLCRDKRRFGMLVIVLAAVAISMSAKGVYQQFVEIPETIESLESDVEGQLRWAGQVVGAPGAMAFESRLRSLTPTGFTPLANVFASLLIVVGFAGAGLVGEKIVAAARSFRSSADDRGRGELHLPTVAAVLTLLAAAPVTVVLVMTRSRGAIASAAVAVVATAVVFAFRRCLAKHRRKTILAIGILVLGAVGVTVSFGLKYDRLPSRTMTFRWHYWTASTAIVRDKPMLGVGGGNFPSAYLRHRRAGAEEAVKTPHNVAVSVLVQYGLGGGVCYLAILAGVLVWMTRPGRDEDEPPSRRFAKGGAMLTFLVIACGVLATRIGFAGSGINASFAILDAVLPSVALLISLVVASWTGWGLCRGASLPGRATRITLAIGLAGFVLHNMVTFSLEVPATAMVFWLAVGACLGRSRDGVAKDLSSTRWLLAPVAVGATIVVTVWLWWPVAMRSVLAEKAAAAANLGQLVEAGKYAEQAGQLDQLDAISAADAARIRARQAGPADALTQAYRWAREAIRRDPSNFAYHRLGGRIAWRQWRRDVDNQTFVTAAVNHMAEAVKRNPSGMRLRLEFAGKLDKANRPWECLAQLRAVVDIDAHLLPGSLERLTPAERDEVKSLRTSANQRIDVIMPAP